jgi:hypothetical protein
MSHKMKKIKTPNSNYAIVILLSRGISRVAATRSGSVAPAVRGDGAPRCRGMRAVPIGPRAGGTASIRVERAAHLEAHQGTATSTV